MFDVEVNGKVIARAENELQSDIYKLNFKGLGNMEIASALCTPIATVRRFTEGHSSR